MRLRIWNSLSFLALLSAGCGGPIESTGAQEAADDGDVAPPVADQDPHYPPAPPGPNVTDAAPHVTFAQIPMALHRRAIQHLYAASLGEGGASWVGAHLSGDIRPINRPDIVGPAYYEMRVIDAAGSTKGFIVLSTGPHDYPVAHWGFGSSTPTDDLLAKASDVTIARFHKIDAINYVAETQSGVFASGTTSVFVRSVKETNIDKGPIHTESYFAAAPVDANGNFDPNGGTLQRKVRRQPLPSTELVSGQQKSGMHPVTAATDLVFRLTGTGDADLYVKKGSAPTLNSFDCRPYTGGSTEECRVSALPGEQVYWMASGYAPTSTVAMTVHEQVLPPVTVTSNVQKTGSYVASASGEIILNLDGTGDADLYVKKGSAPTLGSYDCRPYTGASQEECTIKVTAGDTVYWMVNGYGPSSSVHVTALDRVVPPLDGNLTWADLRANFASLYGDRNAATAKSAADDWADVLALAQYGRGVVSGSTVVIPLLYNDGTFSLSGDTSSILSAQSVDLGGGNKAVQLQIAQSVGNSGNFQLTLHYGLENLDEFATMSPKDADTVKGKIPGAPTGSGPLYRMECQAPGPDDFAYTQIPPASGVNFKAHWSGCGATAWAIMIAWGSNQGCHTSGGATTCDPVYGQLFRAGGAMNGLATPAPMFQSNPFIGPESVVMMELGSELDTFDWKGEGATYEYKMDQANQYTKPRAPVDVDYDHFGGITDTAISHLCTQHQPTILALDAYNGEMWGGHYPVAFAYMGELNVVSRDGNTWKWSHASHGFKLNMGWGGGLLNGAQYYPVDTNLAATLRKQFVPGQINTPDFCAAKPPAERICCYKPWMCENDD